MRNSTKESAELEERTAPVSRVEEEPLVDPLTPYLCSDQEDYQGREQFVGWGQGGVGMSEDEAMDAERLPVVETCQGAVGAHRW